jgi:cytochrome c oxidase subunit IV
MAVSHHLSDEAYKQQVSAVWAATLWLSIATVLEVGIALLHFYIPFIHAMPRPLLNLIFILATLVKAFFIIAEFMHLKYEKRALIISMAVPMIFIFWAIIAFLIEGDTWLKMKLFIFN